MDALSFAKRFLVPDGKYRPLFDSTFIDTGTSNGSRWVEQVYQFRPTEDMFTAGDSVMFEGEMRTLYDRHYQCGKRTRPYHDGPHCGN